MSYQQLEYEPRAVPLPAAVRAFIEDAAQRCDEFYAQNLNRRYPRYIPSDAAQVYAALHHVTSQNLTLGNRFVEWGSGFGVATGLAAMLGYAATGIEHEAELVKRAQHLLADHHIKGRILCQTYLPDGYEIYEAVGGSELIQEERWQAVIEEPPRYEGMEDDLEEIDLFFVYPWPAEQEMMLQLFSAVAGEGAILIVYFSENDIGIYQRLYD